MFSLRDTINNLTTENQTPPLNLSSSPTTSDRQPKSWLHIVAWGSLAVTAIALVVTFVVLFIITKELDLDFVLGFRLKSGK